MILKSIKIKKLFGLYSYDINLQEDLKLNIITGYNGTGKTTILNILDNISKGNLFYFYELPFDEIITEFKERTLKIKASEKKKKEGEGDYNDIPERELLFAWYENSNTNKIHSKIKINKKILDEFNNNTFYRNFYFKDNEKELFIENDKSIYNTIAKKQNNASFMMLTSSVNVKFVESQRLYIFDNNSNKRLYSLKYNDSENSKEQYRKPTIYDIVEKLKEHISKAYYNFLNISQEKSNRLIDNLLNPDTICYNEEQYNKIANELNIIIKDLSSYRLFNDNIREYNPQKKEILSVYVNDLRDKLNTYSKILKELNLFSSLIKRKKFAHKEITFSPQYGLRVINSEKGDIIDSMKLSSGEQNEIILLYKLIFEVPENTLLLIDEPEISLHVVWQKEFMDDIEEISTTRNIQVIIATHSPEIIGDRWDDIYDLSCNNIL